MRSAWMTNGLAGESMLCVHSKCYKPSQRENYICIPKRNPILLRDLIIRYYTTGMRRVRPRKRINFTVRSCHISSHPSWHP